MSVDGRGGEGVPSESRIFVVCTDRGQHQEVRLTYVQSRGAQWSMPVGGSPTRTGYMSPTPDADPAQAGELGVSRTSYVFWCRVCKRNPQVQAERWRTLLEEFERAELRRLDISLLPF